MLLSLFISFSMAHAKENTCADIKNATDFYQCSLQKHPEFEMSQLKAEEAEALVSKAKQWQNPQLEVKSVAGKKNDEAHESTEISLAIPVSQLWTRGAQGEVGEAEKKLSEIDAHESLLSVRKSLIKDLYRLRQIESEQKIVDESVEAFDRVKSQLRSRRARGPEQDISLNLIELASGDYELKKNHLVIEKEEISARIKSLWGPDFEIKKQYLPSPKLAWPMLVDKSDFANSLASRKISALNTKAAAESKLANRESWPSLSAGPTLEKNKEGSTQYDSYGFNLSVSIPIFSQNGGARQYADIKNRQALLQSKYALKKAQLEKSIFIQKYQTAVASLKKSSNRDEVQKKHHFIDRLFKQGLASGGTIIEAHRQITEYTESQHEHELTALDAYIEIKNLNGENIEEIIQ